MAPKNAKFGDGERVLCFHGPLMYEAKCIKAELRESSKGFFYLIHYNGWNKHWDEWVPEARVLKFNDANLQRQKDLLKQHGKDKTKRGKMAKFGKPEKDKPVPPEPIKKPDTAAVIGEPKKKKSRIDPTVESEDAYLAKVEINVKLPNELKPILVDDWDLVTRQKQVCTLPAKDTVNSILEAFLQAHGSNVERASTLCELTSGVKDYFNAMLPTQLLYRFERPQHAEVMESHPGLTPSQIYGMPHLLRLFVRIGPLLSYTALNEKNMAFLVKHMHELLDYLLEHVSTLFDVANYEPVATEYHKKAAT